MAGNLGLDLSGVFADDVDGQTRSGDWDIGADEARPGTGPATPKVVRWEEMER